MSSGKCKEYEETFCSLLFLQEQTGLQHDMFLAKKSVINYDYYTVQWSQNELYCIPQRFEDLLNLHMWSVANFVGIQVPKKQIKNCVIKSRFFSLI